MTDELKDKLTQLVADPPPPTGVPSEAVFARVRTVRRRRAGGAAVLVAAAAVAVAIAAGNLANPNSAPPVTNTPGPTPIVTGPPTVAPTETPPSSTKPSTAVSVNTLPPVTDTGTPPSGDPSSPTNEPSSPATSAPPVEPIKLIFGFQPAINGLTVSMKVNAVGTVMAPTFEEGGTMQAAAFQDNLLYVKYWWGDGTYIEEDGDGGIGCYGADKRVTGKELRQIGKPHTYAKPGAYQFALRVTYCTPNGPQEFTRAWDVIVNQPATPVP